MYVRSGLGYRIFVCCCTLVHIDTSTKSSSRLTKVSSFSHCSREYEADENGEGDDKGCEPEEEVRGELAEETSAGGVPAVSERCCTLGRDDGEEETSDEGVEILVSIVV
jgi:hypothetical protein